ncbi:MAG: hypothetical protein GXO77_16755 [Calditrichaeota bacterium]|nr:hypothetical protein [Calditrichota bacterium]
MLLGIALYKLFESFADKKKTAVKGGRPENKESFQKRYKDIIEDADFEEFNDKKRK